MTQTLSFLESVLRPFWCPFWNQHWIQKGTKNETSFGTLSHRLSGDRELRFCKLNESGEKAIVTGIILSKRKGEISYI
jgi:hypothetical protein